MEWNKRINQAIETLKKRKKCLGSECDLKCDNCTWKLMDDEVIDAIDIVIADVERHRPRVIDMEEIPDLDYDAPTPLWMERRCGDVDLGCDPVIVTQADENGFEYVYADGTAANADGAETFTYNTEIKGYVSCRLWDFEPTNEQRMETPWKPQPTIHPAGATEGVR